jgi:hypothetical protein
VISGADNRRREESGLANGERRAVGLHSRPDRRSR